LSSMKCEIPSNSNITKSTNPTTRSHPAPQSQHTPRPLEASDARHAVL
jgi:hypothetical protein